MTTCSWTDTSVCGGRSH